MLRIYKLLLTFASGLLIGWSTAGDEWSLPALQLWLFMGILLVVPVIIWTGKVLEDNGAWDACAAWVSGRLSRLRPRGRAR